MLERISSPDLRAYVVWLPVLPSGAWESAARREGRRVPDPRATHYYDAAAHLARLYAPLLHLPEGIPAWDVYLVFEPKARWPESRSEKQISNLAPAPTYWMHQLSHAAPRELRLDGDQLARVVNGLLSSHYKAAGLKDNSAPLGSAEFLNSASLLVKRYRTAGRSALALLSLFL